MIVFHHLQELNECVNSSQKDAADLKKMSSTLKENDKIRRELESKLEEAEASLAHSRKQLGVCQQGRQKCVDRESQLDAKEDEMLSLQKKLQEKDSELSAMKMQLAATQQQDMNNKEDTAAAMKNNSELKQTEKATDNPDEERSSDDDLIKETTDSKHEEEESMMTAEAAHEKDGADKGTEDSSSEAVTVSETEEEHKSESLKQLEDPSVDNEETIDDRREIQEEDNNSQQEASDWSRRQCQAWYNQIRMTAKQSLQKQNGIEEKMEEADAKERGPDADMESETQGKLNAGGDDHGYLDVAILPD